MSTIQGKISHCIIKTMLLSLVCISVTIATFIVVIYHFVEGDVPKEFYISTFALLIAELLGNIALTYYTLEKTKKILLPLNNLYASSLGIAHGNFNSGVEIKTDDEIGLIADCLSLTAKQLKERIDYINSLAYTDKLTGLKNNTSYLDAVSKINAEIEEKKAAFSVFVIDINGLKYVNDTFGHQYGNKLIVTAAEIFTDIFGAENIYRVGGDEFVAITDETNELECHKIVEAFECALKNCSPEITLSAACGFAIFDSEKDTLYADAFKKADRQMYREKLRMKTIGESSSVNITEKENSSL